MTKRPLHAMKGVFVCVCMFVSLMVIKKKTMNQFMQSPTDLTFRR